MKTIKQVAEEHGSKMARGLQSRTLAYADEFYNSFMAGAKFRDEQIEELVLALRIIKSGILDTPNSASNLIKEDMQTIASRALKSFEEKSK